ncbi:MAG: alanine--glyoxylate aminotransferase family protein, partial [Myxococcales bacterium]|nr:alanine--glyoxylate aminotransferase family protein [Myxococcales bacterium]
GKFGERWTKICQAYGVEAIELKVEWGQAVDPQAVREALKKNPGVKAVYWQGSETSTGVAHPTKELAGIVRETSAISVVDGITAVGVIDIPSDDWGIDILVTGSQKALMLPPGLAFASVSPKAWELNKTAKCPRFYFDYKRENKALQANTTAWTPATSLIVGLAEVLKMMKEETREKVFARHTWLAHATREAAQAMGLKLLAPAAPSNALTAIWAPEGVDGGKIVKTLRNDLGITIAGGQDHLKGKIFRIAHLGYFDRFDVITAISATEMVLKKLGHKFQAGAGMAKANELLGL